MQLLLIRHGKAEMPEIAAKAGRSEAERELTDEGRKEMRQIARSLETLVDIDVLATSPLVRARETANAIAKVFHVETLPLPALAPGLDRAELLRWLREQSPDACCAIVGHEPDLGALVGWFICGDPAVQIEIKKASATLLEFSEAPAPGAGILRWLLPPKVLRSIRRD